MEELVCKNCGVIQLVTEAKLSATKMKNGNLHIKADCNSCGKWIKWVNQTPEILELLNIEKTHESPEFAMDFDTPDNKEHTPVMKHGNCDMDFTTVDNDGKPLVNTDCPFDY